MKKLFDINGHSFVIKNKTLIVDGVPLGIKLESTKFNPSVDHIAGKKWGIQIGENDIIIDKESFEVNGQNFSYEEIDELRKKTGVVKGSKKPYGYTFKDVEIVNGGKVKDFSTPSPKAKSEKKRRFSLFSFGDVTQVIVNDSKSDNSEKANGVATPSTKAKPEKNHQFSLFRVGDVKQVIDNNPKSDDPKIDL